MPKKLDAISKPTRRDFIIGSAASVLAAKSPGFLKAARALVEINPDLSPLNAAIWTRQFTNNLLTSGFLIFEKNIFPATFSEELSLPDICRSIGHLLKVDPLVRKKHVDKAEPHHEQETRLVQLYKMDNDALIKRALQEYQAFKAHCAVNQAQRNYTQEWPGLAQPANAQSAPPAWWHTLDEEGKFKVYFEACVANGFHTPLGIFFEGEQLRDILRDNIGFTKNDPTLGFVRPPLSHFLFSFGPGQGKQEFLRGREAIYQLENHAAADAKKAAARDLEEIKLPPVISISRWDNDFFAPRGKATYVARLTSHAGQQEDFRRLFQMFQHLSHELGPQSEKQAKSTPLSISWQGSRLFIEVARDSATNSKMMDLYKDCHEWDAAWFREQPHGLEPEPLRPEENLMGEVVAREQLEQQFNKLLFG